MTKDPSGGSSKPAVRRANAAYVVKDPTRWRHKGWASTPNSIIRDPDIPPDECWAWTWLASHDGEFEVSGRRLYEAKTSLSRNRAYELLSNLERRGLLLRTHEFDHDAQVPYVLYHLQPEPVPEEQRTWVPPRRQPRQRGPHPGSKAAQQAAAQSEPPAPPIHAGQQAFPTGREPLATRTFPTSREPATTGTFPSGREPASAAGVPDRAGIPDDQHIPDRTGIHPDQHVPDPPGVRVDSRAAGSRPAGNPSKEEKTTGKEHPTDHPDPAHNGGGGLDVIDGQPATDTTPGAELLASLPHPWTLGRRAIAQHAPYVTELLAAGWGPSDLEARWTSRSAENPAGALRYRIEDTPRTPPPAPAKVASPAPPWCGQCGGHLADGWAATNPRQRLIYDPMSGAETPCPTCHPTATRRASAARRSAS